MGNWVLEQKVYRELDDNREDVLLTIIFLFFSRGSNME